MKPGNVNNSILLKIRPELVYGKSGVLCQQGNIVLKLLFEHLPEISGTDHVFSAGNPRKKVKEG